MTVLAVVWLWLLLLLLPPLVLTHPPKYLIAQLQKLIFGRILNLHSLVIFPKSLTYIISIPFRHLLSILFPTFSLSFLGRFLILLHNLTV